VIAHFDINNCYCSIEAVFNPKLRGLPCVVLSNNDGCVVARSPEAKALGIAMGEPWHLIADKHRAANVQALSSNYALYGDMSRRVMDTARTFAERMEIYSIDEAFLDYSPGANIDKVGRELRATIRRHTGLTVSVGIAPTKVLAKASNRVSKKDPSRGGVFEWPDGGAGEQILCKMKPSDVWGIAGRLEARVAKLGIEDALALSTMPDELARRVLTITGHRIVMELRGIPCLELEEVASAKKSIVCSRSFGRSIESEQELVEAVAAYAESVSSKLRTQKLTAERIQVFASTNPFKPDEEQFHDSVGYTFDTPTNLSFDLIGIATRAAKSLYRPGVRYKRAGVMVFGLGTENATQLSFDSMPAPELERKRRLLAAVDSLNRELGRGTVRSGSVAADPAWKMRAKRLSPRYTTQLSDLPIAFA